MTAYIEKRNTHKKLMNDQLKLNIKSLNIMAANMLNPDDYVSFLKLMNTLKEGYK